MSDLNNSEDFGDTAGFYPKRREGLGNFFMGMLTGVAVVIGVFLLIIGIGGPGALPLPFLSSPTPFPTATIAATLTFTPSLTFTASPETPAITPTPNCPAEYVIQSGDLLSTIAEKCGISVEAIVALNPTIDPNNIQVGTTILLPPAGTGFTPTVIPADTIPGTVISIRVQAGDTLESIAGKCWSTVDDLIKTNNIDDPNFLSVGMELKCHYGIATPVPSRVSPTFGPTPTYTVTPAP
ncbi:MAG: LysM peptidoglycan-binding domain-containing protein [Anaerolineales bacterium]|nr:LysM peptidoglycan-binding domain-containing protein [Anaerolineales bacterium]